MKKYLLLLVCATGFVSAIAQIKLPRLISNGMVLQRDVPIKIWGWAAANEPIHVSFAQKEFSTTADASGNWMIEMPKQKTGGPYSMQLKASNEIILYDILIGDVWLCGGQSNMELWMDRLKYKYAAEIANADNPNIRQFLVPDKYDFVSPQKDLDAGTWQAVTTKSIGEFSGVAYFFAKEIYEIDREDVISIASLASAYNNLGAANYLIGNLEEAMEYFSQASLTLSEADKTIDEQFEIINQKILSLV